MILKLQHHIDFFIPQHYIFFQQMFFILFL